MIRLTFIALVAVWPLIPERLFLMIAPFVIVGAVLRTLWRLA